MNRFSLTERQSLLQLLNLGKRDAINARRIASHLHYPIGGNQVKTRNLIRESIELEVDLIAGSLSNPKGFYIADTSNLIEFNFYLDSLENRATEIINPRNYFIADWNHAVPNSPITKLPLTIS